MVVKILIGLAILIFCVVVYALVSAPKTVVIARSILIGAVPEIIFPYINNPRRMEEWNPFTKDDETLKMTYSGPDEGVGAQSAWEGNSKTGIGQATITESEINKRVAVRLDFKKPFVGTNAGEYRLESKDGATKFTWTITESALIPRVLSRILNIDKMVGAQLEKGLANLKTLIENK